MRLHVEAEGDCRQRVKIIPYGQYDAQERQTEDKHPGVSCQKKDDIFEFICSRSNDAPTSDHSLDLCTMCQRANFFRTCLVESTFHQAIVRLLSMKYHILSSGIVWGIF